MQATNGTGEFSVIKANDNSGKGLPGGTVNKKLSAAQLAATQQAIKQANTAAAANQTGPLVLGTGDGYTQVSTVLCFTTGCNEEVHPASMCSKSGCHSCLILHIHAVALRLGLQYV